MVRLYLGKLQLHLLHLVLVQQALPLILLRPHANFQLEGTQFTQWSCPNNSQPPEWSEVMAQLELDKRAYEEWQQNNLPE